MSPKDAKFLHFRIFDNGVVQSRGGLTVAFYEEPPVDGQIETRKIHFAYAMCHDRDNYIKHIGRVKAAGRLDSKHYCQTFEGDTTAFINNQDALAQSYTGMKRKFNKKKYRDRGTEAATGGAA